MFLLLSVTTPKSSWMCLSDIFSLITKLQDVVYAIYLLIILQALEFIHTICKSFVPSSIKRLAFFHHLSFFNCNCSNNFAFALCFSLFWWFTFLFFSVECRSRRHRWLWFTRFYPFTSFHGLLFYQHFINKIYILFFIFLATAGNNKSLFTFHAIIIHPTEIFWNKRSVNVLIKPVHFF